MQREGLKATKRWPLWGQITLALGGTMLLMSVLAGVYVRAFETRYVLNTLQTQSQRTFALLAAVTLDAIIAEDRPVLEIIVTRVIRQDPDIVSVTIDNKEGRPLVQWQDPTVQPRLSLQAFSQDLTLAGEKFGRLTMAWNMAEQQAAMQQHATWMQLFSVGILGLLTVSIALLVLWLAIW